MAFKIALPQVGESVTEAIIGKWLKSPGEHIDKYDSLVEIITDKVNMDVPAPETGTLTKILVSEGDTVPMGSVIAEMETDEAVSQDAPTSPATPGTAPAASPGAPPLAGRIGTLVQGANVGPTGGEFLDTSLSSPTSSSSPPPTATAKPAGEKRRFSPVVTRLAAQHGVDLNALAGTGLDGRVTKKDVLTAAEEGNTGAVPAALPSRGAVPAASGDRVIEPTPIRRMIANHMVKSMTEIPHAWSAIEVDVTGMVEWRAANRERFEQEHGVRLTYLPVTLRSVVAALKTNPQINSSWVDGNIVLKGAINVGVAVATGEGLVVPVVHDTANSTLLELARQLDAVIERARNASMTLDDVQGGTFTLNNTGALGSVLGGAIINHPQAAILTTEAIVKRPVVITKDGVDTVVVRSMMNICLSFDHRIIDGAEASTFMQAVRAGLEAVEMNSDFE